MKLYDLTNSQVVDHKKAEKPHLTVLGSRYLFHRLPAPSKKCLAPGSWELFQ